MQLTIRVQLKVGRFGNQFLKSTVFTKTQNVQFSLKHLVVYYTLLRKEIPLKTTVEKVVIVRHGFSKVTSPR